MIRMLFLALIAAVPVLAMAQHFPGRVMTVEEIKPENCEIFTATGDLNKDGRADVVIIATPKNKQHMKTRDDGYTYNFNQPVLAIYFATRAGGYELWKKYDKMLPHPEDEYYFINTSVTITERGTLQFDIEGFSSAGSYGSSNNTYLFRYQDNDFYLIGSEYSEFSRNTGESVKTSNNYLTNKCLTTKSNEFDKNVKTTSKWSKLPAKPLRRMGFELE